MADMSDFHFETSQPVFPKAQKEHIGDWKVDSIQFLVPVKIKTSGVKEIVYDAHIDCVNKEVYVDGRLAGEEFHEKVFGYLHGVTNTLDQDFQASPEIYEQADAAHAEMNNLEKTNLEDANG
jgi:hypothetical protein